MATLNGVVRRDSFSLPSNTSPNENEYDALFANGLGNPTAKRSGSALTNNQPVTVQPRKSLNGEIRRTYGDLWFNRIHIIPAFLALGNLVARQVRTVEVFNGYLSSDAILTAVDATDTDGLDLDYGTLPATIGSLDSIFLVLTIDEQGAPDFDSSFSFTFTGKDAPDLRVTGTRVVTFPFRHNWTESYRERLEYLTDIAASEDGTEQRRMFRDGVPRRTLIQNVLLQNSELDDVRLHARIRNKFLNLLRGWQARTLCAPVISDEEQLLADLPQNSDYIPLETIAKDYEPGSYVMLYIDDSTFDLYAIESVEADRINLSRPTGRDFPAGASFVSPAKFVRFNDSQNFTEINKGVTSVTVEFDLLEDQEFTSRELPHEMPEYLGRSVWLPLSTPSGDKQHSVRRQISVIDAATGLVWQSSQELAGRETTALEHYFLDRTQIGQMFGWLAERRGELVEFWYPTDEYDFIVTENVGANTANLTVDNTDFARFVFEQNSNNHVCVKLTDGRVFYREITSAITNDDGLSESLTLDSPLSETETLTPDEIDRVCFLRLVRLASDRQEIEWINSDQVAWLPSVIDVLGEEDSTDGY